jgi:hypothetical protein
MSGTPISGQLCDEVLDAPICPICGAVAVQCHPHARGHGLNACTGCFVLSRHGPRSTPTGIALTVAGTSLHLIAGISLSPMAAL